MKIYEGKRLEPLNCVVTVDGEPLRHRVRHSPTGFEWGYGGSGPADLALSLLWDCCGEEIAKTWYQAFKQAVVAHLPRLRWELTEENIKLALQTIRDREKVIGSLRNEP